MNQVFQSAKIQAWLAHPPTAAVRTALERLSSHEDIAHIAVMPDVHLAEGVCIGTVLGTMQGLYPQAVGGDIGCGMAAVRIETTNTLFSTATAATQMLQGLKLLVPALRHSKATGVAQLPEELRAWPLSANHLEKAKNREGRVQFGTLGRGNHFLEIQRDQAGAFWVMVHTGSRAMGQLIAHHHRKSCTSTSKGLDRLEAEEQQGQAYLQDVAWARRYAECNRWAILEAVAVLLEKHFAVTLAQDTLFSCDHNHLQKETHAGQTLWVHRKGAVAASDAMAGIIPGSMGAPSFHTLGRGCSAALGSSSHGAGRSMSRTEARQRISLQSLRQQMQGIWFDQALALSLCDEAPQAYKNIGQVMRAQRALVRIVRKLEPILNL